MTQTNNPGSEKKYAKHICGNKLDFPGAHAAKPVFLAIAALFLLMHPAPASAAKDDSTAPAPATPVLDIEYATQAFAATPSLSVVSYSTSTVFAATYPMPVPAVATGTASSATSSQESGATAAVVSAAATPTLFQQFHDETLEKCKSNVITENIMDYMIKHFDVIQDGFQNEAIERVVGCLALEREDESNCDKLQMLPESSKNNFPYVTYIEACKEKVATFNVMKDAFSGKECKKKMEAYCRETNVCKRTPTDGKICTCPLYAAIKCGIPSRNTVEQCNGLRPEIEKALTGNKKDIVEKHVRAVLALCQKAVLGVNPMENERDIGSSVSLFFGGLFSGATWPVFAKDADPEKFGLPREYAYWYDYVYKHRSTCLKHLDIFRESFCAPYAFAVAREKEQEALKKLKEEADAKKKKENEAAPEAGDKNKKENK